MDQVSISISKDELQEVVKAYNTIQNFLVKILPKSEIYQSEFIDSMNNAIEDIDNNNITEIKSYDEFIA
jgi:hypothetical protein